jgi:peptide/nickel transport system substrate-binding protein
MAWHGRTLALAFVLVVFACTGSSGAEPSTRPRPEVVTGGTLRLAVPDHGLSLFADLDPQAVWSGVGFELFRCCLLRTLLSYNGRPTEQGGAELRADLAEGVPEVSADGLTWTFRLRSGVEYAPPLEDTEIVSADLVRALEREATPVSAPAYPFYYSVIKGFDEYAAGTADSIIGLETPDERTLVVRLHEPTSDLGYRFSLPATAPIPPDAAEGHEDGYGPFLIASGPYMIEGAQDLDPTLPPAQQQPVSGFVPASLKGDTVEEPGSLTLVRNPSWEPSTDDLRPAYPDRIEIALGGDPDELAAAVERSELDMVFAASGTAQQVERYQEDPALADRLFVDPNDTTLTVSMNLAVPPFDDVHVRRAVNLAIDKAALVELLARPPYGPFGLSVGIVATHIAPDSLEGNLLSGYDPYPNDLAGARAEMRLSGYDGDGDGRCDAAACRDVVALVNGDPEQGRSIQRDLAAIGVDLAIEPLPVGAFFRRLTDPATRTPMGIGAAWGKDYPNGSGWFPPLFASSQLELDEPMSWTLVGATKEQLEGWGYSVTSVPNVDDRIDRCLALLGLTQTECWAELDRYLMMEIVPWVPYVTLAHAQTVSERVVGYSFDQFAGEPALDRIQLAPG